MSKTAINPTRQENFAEWYQQVVHAADLAENSPVRGCMVIKPYGYAIWENIKEIFDKRIKEIGVQNAYFPLLIPLEFLEKEAKHIDGFATECAVVTHHRLKKDKDGKLIPDGELSSPYIIRPTSETIIGSVISKWINSYRDLPLKLNQWCNVMRWEMRPRVFLRTSEFLWQEGHNVFATEQEAVEDALKMQQMYYDLVTKDLCMAAIKGEKTEEERFPGAKNSYTVEAMMQDGKALQANTSHYLGQSFSKAFDIKFLGKDGKEALGFTTSWGMSTRLIGGLIMTHSDDDGLILPPSIAPYHIVIIPILHDNANASDIIAHCNHLKSILSDNGLRVNVDLSENTNPNKIWHWIKKGVPVRIEIGAKEIANESVTLARRDLGHKDKKSISFDQCVSDMSAILNEITLNIRARANEYMNGNMKNIETLPEIDKVFASGFQGFVVTDKVMTDQKEFSKIAETHALSRRCIMATDNTKVLIGKSY